MEDYEDKINMVLGITIGVGSWLIILILNLIGVVHL